MKQRPRHTLYWATPNCHVLHNVSHMSQRMFALLHLLKRTAAAWPKPSLNSNTCLFLCMQQPAQRTPIQQNLRLTRSKAMSNINATRPAAGSCTSCRIRRAQQLHAWPCEPPS
jgi:hypothetical protein